MLYVSPADLAEISFARDAHQVYVDCSNHDTGEKQYEKLINYQKKIFKRKHHLMHTYQTLRKMYYTTPSNKLPDYNTWANLQDFPQIKRVVNEYEDLPILSK